jgi:glycosyltransferase involved in cell wall biosynthesis
MESHMMPFTVIIPTHNGRATISRAVSSVLEQSHSELELLVVCDGDSTATRAMLSNCKDTRLRVLEQPKAGVSAARNLGIFHASNGWVCFLDDDDYARPNWLQCLSAAIDADTVAITARLAFWEQNKVVSVWDCQLSLTDPTMDASTILPGGFATRHELLAAVGGFDETLTYSENQDLGLRLLDHMADSYGPEQIVHVPEILVDFHRQPASARARRYRDAPAESARIFLTRYQDRLDADGRTKAALFRIIARAERQQLNSRAAVDASLNACRAQPLHWANGRSLALALVSGPSVVVKSAARRVRSTQ